MTKLSFLFFALAVSVSLANADEGYFYCGFTNMDGTGQDYAKWGKGTDFKFNSAKKRWEWITEYTFQHIYADGRYEQIPRVSFFDDQRGRCDAEMEKAYKRRVAELTKKHGG